MDTILDNLRILYDAISDCLARRQHLPTLILLYSGIDIVAAIEPGLSSRKAFVSWVDSYLLPAKPFSCTALDFYAARCGILHTLTPESDLYRNNKAHAIYYGWGTAESSDLAAAIARTSARNRAFVVNVEEFKEAFLIGVLTWADEIHADHVRQQRVEAQRGKWFVNMKPELIRQFVSEYDSKSQSKK